jgi:hypothetical protein
VGGAGWMVLGAASPLSTPFKTATLEESPGARALSSSTKSALSSQQAEAAFERRLEQEGASRPKFAQFGWGDAREAAEPPDTGPNQSPRIGSDQALGSPGHFSVAARTQQEKPDRLLRPAEVLIAAEIELPAPLAQIELPAPSAEVPDRYLNSGAKDAEAPRTAHQDSVWSASLEGPPVPSARASERTAQTSTEGGGTPFISARLSEPLHELAAVSQQPLNVNTQAATEGPKAASVPNAEREHETAMLVRRAEALIVQKDSAGARLFLKRAADLGHPGASAQLSALPPKGELATH